MPPRLEACKCLARLHVVQIVFDTSFWFDIAMCMCLFRYNVRDLKNFHNSPNWMRSIFLNDSYSVAVVVVVVRRYLWGFFASYFATNTSIFHLPHIWFACSNRNRFSINIFFYMHFLQSHFSPVTIHLWVFPFDMFILSTPSIPSSAFIFSHPPHTYSNTKFVVLSAIFFFSFVFLYIWKLWINGRHIRNEPPVLFRF